MDKIKELLSRKDETTVGYCFSTWVEDNSEGDLEKYLMDCIEKAISYISEYDPETENQLSDFGCYICLVRKIHPREYACVGDMVIDWIDENHDLIGLNEPFFKAGKEDVEALDEKIAKAIEEWIKERNIKVNDHLRYHQVRFTLCELREAFEYLTAERKTS